MRDHHEFESPVDLPGIETKPHALRWTTVTIAVASIFLLGTNAFSLRGWIEEQPVGPLQAQLADMATRWEDATAAVGLSIPRSAVHREWKAAEAARFDPEATDQR